MATVKVQVVVTAADRAAAEDYLSAYGSYPLSAELTTYPGDPAAQATHHGLSLSCLWPGALHDALVAMPGLFPGSSVGVVQYTSPYWKAYQTAVHWTAWLNSLGLQVRQG
jgi:hypothetical protein